MLPQCSHIFSPEISDESEPTFWWAELSQDFLRKGEPSQVELFALKTSFVDSQMDITVLIIWKKTM